MSENRYHVSVEDNTPEASREGWFTVSAQDIFAAIADVTSRIVYTESSDDVRILVYAFRAADNE